MNSSFFIILAWRSTSDDFFAGWDVFMMYFSLLTKWYTAVTLQALVSMCSVPFLKIRNRTGRPSVHPFGKVLWAFFASIAHQALSFAAPQGPWPCRALTTMLNGEVVPEKIKHLMCTNYILTTHRIPMLCPSSWARVLADSKSVVPISIMFICFPVKVSQAASKKAMPSLRPLPEFWDEWMLQIIYQDHIIVTQVIISPKNCYMMWLFSKNEWSVLPALK